MADAATPFRPLATRDDLDEALARSDDGPVLIYKHSSTCPISARAQQSLEALTEAADPPVYRLVVQEARDLSAAVADELGVRHESPQALLLMDRQPVFDASHGQVRAEAVREVARQHDAG